MLRFLFSLIIVIMMGYVGYTTDFWASPILTETQNETPSHTQQESNSIDGAPISSECLVTSILDLNSVDLHTASTLHDSFINANNINSDTYGWLRVRGFNIDNPVLWSGDNQRYLRTNIYGEYDIAGEVFLDGNCIPYTSPVLILHGHNLKNDSMFSKLPELLMLDDLNSAPIIELYDTDGLKLYKIISVFSTDSTEILVPSEEVTIEKLQTIKQTYIDRSKVPVSDIPNGIEMLILNTCWYGQDGNEKGLHCIVVSVRV